MSASAGFAKSTDADDLTQKALISAEGGGVMPAVAPAPAGSAGFGQGYGGTAAASDFTAEDLELLQQWMYRVNGCYQCQCLCDCIDPSKLPATAKRQALFPRFTADVLQERLQRLGETLEGDDERAAIEQIIQKLRGGPAATGKAYVGVWQSRVVYGFWGLPSAFVSAMDRLTAAIVGMPVPSNTPVCQVPVIWLACSRCFGGQCGNQDARYDGCRTLALGLYFGTVVTAIYDMLIALMLYVYILPVAAMVTLAFDCVMALLSLIFIWGFIILGRQDGMAFHEILNIGLLEGYGLANTFSAKRNRRRGCGPSPMSMMRIEETLSKKSNLPLAKVWCSSRLCYHPAEAIVSDDMCATFYTYGDAANTNLTVGDVEYYRQAHQQLRATWEAAMGMGFSG